MDPLLELALAGAAGFTILGCLVAGATGAVIGLASGIVAATVCYRWWKGMGGPFG